MKNTKRKIILSAIVCLAVVGFAGTSVASSLFVSPATSTKTAGDVFTVSVGFSASGSKVCAVEGTLVFNGLTCQSITVSSDVMAQTSPTCSSPKFLIGIPNCTTLDKTLLTVSVKAGSAGTASVSATGVDIIGEGASVGSTSTNGNYTITAPIVVQQPVVQPKEQSVVKAQPKVTQENPEEVVIPQSEETTPAPIVATTTEVNVAQAGLFGAFMNVMSLGTGKTWLANLLIIIILIVIAFGVFYFVKKTHEKK